MPTMQTEPVESNEKPKQPPPKNDRAKRLAYVTAALAACAGPGPKTVERVCGWLEKAGHPSPDLIAAHDGSYISEVVGRIVKWAEAEGLL